MARLPFVNADTPGVDADLVRAVMLRRGGSLLNLDRLLLHSAPVARGWNAYLGAIRGACVLDGACRELAILLVARLNRAPYEFFQHEPLARQAGVSPEKISALDAWSHASVFTARERAVLAYTQAMTLDVQVDEPTFDALRAWFKEREIVELTATIAAYNMVSRFLEALGIEAESPIAQKAGPR
ncbi:MAG: carboxymuconolactone decarboxylase family protein [Burkholderiaceae bacterium]